MSKVAVIFGGETWEREGSILSACDVARSLDRQGIENWMCEYVPGLLEGVDLDISAVFNAGHGAIGEDGTLAEECERLGLRYTFSPPTSHRLAFDKRAFKRFAQSLDVRVADTVEEGKILRDEVPRDKEWIIKPAFAGGSKGISHIGKLESAAEAWSSRDRRFDPYFIEEFIDGRFLSCAICGDDEIDAKMHVLEVRFQGKVYDYHKKHDVGSRTYIAPAAITAAQANDVKREAVKLFVAMRAKGFVRFDFIIDSSGKLFLLEANTVPGLSQKGNLAAIWQGTGLSYDDMVSYALRTSSAEV